MRKFILGAMVGLTIGVSISAAYANGWMYGWTVEKDGEIVCTGPYIWQATKTIECD